MAQGIQLAGGYGAGGVRDALVDLIAQRMAEQDFAEKQRARMTDEQMARDTLAQRRTESATRTKHDADRLSFDKTAHGEDLGLRRRDQELREKDIELRGRPDKPRMVTLRGVRDPKTGKPTTRMMTEDEAAGQSFEEYVAPKEPRAPREERLVQIAGPDGAAIWVRESQAEGKPAAQAARSVTGSERQTLAYFNRAKEASDYMTTPDKSGTSLEQRIAAQRIDNSLWGKFAPNLGQTEEQQLYRQAQRAFTEARLRKESGAAIPTDEYENDAATYFAQPGDAPAVVQRKQKARQAVLDGLKFSSGKAYDEFYGEGAGAAGGGAKAGPKVDEIRMINGQRARWDGKGWLPAQ